MAHKPIRLKGAAKARLWQKVLDRDGQRCNTCGGGPDGSIHHILSTGQGGGDIEDNMAFECTTCHDLIHHGSFEDLMKRILGFYGPSAIKRYFLMGVVSEKHGPQWSTSSQLE